MDISRSRGWVSLRPGAADLLSGLCCQGPALFQEAPLLVTQLLQGPLPVFWLIALLVVYCFIAQVLLAPGEYIQLPTIQIVIPWELRVGSVTLRDLLAAWCFCKSRVLAVGTHCEHFIESCLFYL